MVKESIINIVYTINPDINFWETDWINELLQSKNNVTYNSITDLNTDIIYDNAIIITQDPKNCESYLQKYIINKKKFCLIHLSDEYYQHTLNVYASEYCYHIFRNYYTDRIKGSKISFIPLGYIQTFWKGYNGNKITDITVHDRKFIWTFYGSLQYSNRKEYINSILDIKPNNYRNTLDWNSSVMIKPEQYRDILLYTIFVPCLTGHKNVDTFRLYEALEAGCIPIVYRFQSIFGHYPCYGGCQYFLNLLGNHPLISIDNWNDLNKTIKFYLNDRNELEKKRMEIYT